MKRVDACRILRIPEHASLDEARRAYRRRARETHPDCGGSNTAFCQVAEAWSVLQAEPAATQEPQDKGPTQAPSARRPHRAQRTRDIFAQFCPGPPITQAEIRAATQYIRTHLSSRELAAFFAAGEDARARRLADLVRVLRAQQNRRRHPAQAQRQHDRTQAPQAPLDPDTAQAISIVLLLPVFIALLSMALALGSS